MKQNKCLNLEDRASCLKGYDNCVSLSWVEFSAWRCQPRAHDVGSTQDKFNGPFVYLLVWKNKRIYKKEKQQQQKKQKGHQKAEIKIQRAISRHQKVSHTFMQQSEGWVERSFSLSEEKQLSIHCQDFNVFMAAINKETNVGMNLQTQFGFRRLCESKYKLNAMIWKSYCSPQRKENIKCLN